MYSLDINFLNDRPDYKPVDVNRERKSKSTTSTDQTPIIVGAVVALALNGAVGGAYWWLTQENSRTGERKAVAEQEAAKLEAQVAEITKIKTETQKIEGEYKALGTVFDQIKPWSAMWRDLGDRIPPGVKISKIDQTEPSPAPVVATPAAAKTPSPSPSGSPAASASPATPATPVAPPAPIKTATLVITGVASSFEQVNDFVLLIQRSPFFKDADTKLLGATLKNNTTQIALQNKSAGGANELPKLRPIVEYKIETALSDTPASQLLPELRSKQADGLAIRIETLQEKGVIAQQPEVKKP
ncbi:PilN domain-containing protein [Kamptonema sp. UHCC 0994]|uniref:PilN domain-containing protein n=1 Tax=Kamptonema sp. UHCC 0994 TaxID=3031329 RepID=UPI0023B97356|nr:PilN domain-containing protein [Kamptonema sp. UHCC 0994]MDF0554138.1 PilN domain-containing protein [Kamptonema sp. UHCC 0994]